MIFGFPSPYYPSTDCAHTEYTRPWSKKMVRLATITALMILSLTSDHTFVVAGRLAYFKEWVCYVWQIRFSICDLSKKRL